MPFRHVVVIPVAAIFMGGCVGWFFAVEERRDKWRGFSGTADEALEG